LALLLLAGTTAAAAQSYPPPPPPPGAYDDQPYYDDQGGYYSDNYQDQDAYDQQGYPDAGYDNQGPVDVSLFYGELAPYGRWIERGRYGWVWEPMRVPVGWRPYSRGRWVETDYGWTWISYEPWGWATYHYGRWLLDPEYGWLWVPGTEWGPAWVAFQEGEGYIGWAPLPPSVGFRVGIGIQIGGLSLSAAIDPYAFSFVPERNFLDERLEDAVLPPARNVTFIRNTRNITNIRVDHDRVVNESIPVERVEQATGQRVRRFQVNESRTPDRGRVAQVQGDQISIFRPAVKLAPTRPNVTPPVMIARRQQQRQAVQPPPDQQGQPEVRPRQLPAPHLMPPQPGQPPTPSNARPAPAQVDLERKHQAEQQQLQARQQEEQRRLQQLQERDNADRQAQGQAQQQRAAQHQAEQKALQDQHQREQQLLEARHQRERQAAQARPQGQNPREQQNQQRRNRQQEREKKPEPPPPPN